ncbi:8-amino-7-oxononanoate synthase [Thioflexithrix psekupsensis]|uniref:8-amino-7-oxononanoate synthase n=1 Tax=Thioflexithrix psekupsensis TaxID=1570016 RepID=A0A251XAU3_9GAMM|nr:8-amino-7-oxononanoate synthase [Thioflexithrix psekupsensis]OUD15220.1 8-amino-7-oxononanoate synthase [Thioflexithrix psekupsensis]
MSLHDFLNAQLAQRHRDQLYRQPWPHHGKQQPLLRHHGRDYLSFCSNDYLGLASDSRLIDTLQHASKDYGIGSGASHLVSGHHQAHQELESALAKFLGRERALVFSTGYMANIGVMTALMGREDAIFADKFNHASLVDGSLLSRAQSQRYAHLDMAALANLLARSEKKHRLIISDGVFSMDGDIAPLPELLHLAQQYDAWLMLDDAHGLGVLGETGRGTEAYFNALNSVPILVGTFSKAFGGMGAFVAGSALLIDYMIQAARSYIYTTALPPALAEVNRHALHLAQTESWRREHLHFLIDYFRQQAKILNIPLMPSITPIQGIILGSAERALTVSQALWQRGLFVTAIRPPTVPLHRARLRITFSALHQKEQVDQLLSALAELLSPCFISTDTA